MLNLKQLRAVHGISASALSRLSGVSLRTIQDAEARGDCRLSTAYALAAALGVSLDDMWIEDPNTSPS